MTAPSNSGTGGQSGGRPGGSGPTGSGSGDELIMPSKVKLPKFGKVLRAYLPESPPHVDHPDSPDASASEMPDEGT